MCTQAPFLVQIPTCCTPPPPPKSRTRREETEGRTALYFIINCVTAGDRLSLPTLHDLTAQGLSEALAKPLLRLTESCWAQLPVERPTMAEIACSLTRLINKLREERRGAAMGRSPAHSSSGGGMGGRV
jgi:hypothetical protein